VPGLWHQPPPSAGPRLLPCTAEQCRHSSRKPRATQKDARSHRRTLYVCVTNAITRFTEVSKPITPQCATHALGLSPPPTLSEAVPHGSQHRSGHLSETWIPAGCRVLAARPPTPCGVKPTGGSASAPNRQQPHFIKGYCITQERGPSALVKTSRPKDPVQTQRQRVSSSTPARAPVPQIRAGAALESLSLGLRTFLCPVYSPPPHPAKGKPSLRVSKHPLLLSFLVCYSLHCFLLTVTTRLHLLLALILGSIAPLLNWPRYVQAEQNSH